MKLLLMLAAIYALIINQSLKQKDKNPARANINTKRQDIKPDDNVYSNAVYKANTPVKSLPARKNSKEHRNPSGKAYEDYLFKPENDLNVNLQHAVLYPVNYSKQRSR